MKKDIPIQQVVDVGIAIVPDEDGAWQVYLINNKAEKLRHVMVCSRGYGEIEGEKTETSTLRYYYDNISPKTAFKVELIVPELLKLANEYWVSFSLNDYLFDKKYVFVKGSIDEEYFTNIPILEKRGVLIM